MPSVRFDARATNEPQMFLVRLSLGARKPRVYRIDPREVTCIREDKVFIRRLEPRAWWVRMTAGAQSRAIGIAAIANSIEEAHELIARLKASQLI